MLGMLGILAEAGEASTAMVQVVLDHRSFGLLAGAIASGLIVIGGAKGIGNIAGNAVEAISRQPEAGGRIFTTMMIGAAMIEGVTLLALIVCMLAVRAG